MTEAKLTVRVERDLLENAKRYASRQHTNLTELIHAFLTQLPDQTDLADAPIVRRLSGILPNTVGVDDYKKHLDEKYG